ncbi:hypothetical protein Tco_0825574 [Tanacetum coccineum]
MPVPSSQKATSSSAPSSNPMSPPADLVKPYPPSEGSCVALSCGQMYSATFKRSEGSCVASSYGQMYSATFKRRFPLGT